MLAFKYIMFALVAMAGNLVFQFASLSVYGATGALYVAMFTGTLAGLVIKYALDKMFIFYHRSDTHADNAKTFIGYSATGVFTTLIFWATELAFDYAWENPSAKYVGAVIGLSVGYLIKYRLDRKFVFREAT